MGGQKRSCLDQPIRAMAVGEADVVAYGQVIETARHRALGEFMQAARPGAEIVLAQDDPHLDGRARRGRTTCSRPGGALGGGGDGGLQPEHQRAGQASGIRALKDPAGVGAGGEQAGDPWPDSSSTRA